MKNCFMAILLIAIMITSCERHYYNEHQEHSERYKHHHHDRDHNDHDHDHDRDR